MSELNLQIERVARKLEDAAHTLRKVANKKVTPKHKVQEVMMICHYLLPNIGAASLLDCLFNDLE